MYVMYVTQLRQQNIYCIPAHQYNNNKVVLAGMLALANISVKKDSSVSEFKTYSQMILPQIEFLMFPPVDKFFLGHTSSLDKPSFLWLMLVYTSFTKLIRKLLYIQLSSLANLGLLVW